MRKLSAAIRYLCTTAFKYIWIFYIIMYAVVIFISLLIGFSIGSFENVGVNCLETNTLIYVGILGALGYKDDFKMLIQNGFTRKYIFAATLTLFAFICGTMAMVDTVMGNLLTHFTSRYHSLYSALYTGGNVFANWLWLFLLYMVMCSFIYFGILLLNKIGKRSALLVYGLLAGFVLLIIALFRYVFPESLVHDAADLLMKAFGFMADGSINHLLPALTLLALTGVLSTAAYALLRRTELK